MLRSTTFDRFELVHRHEAVDDAAHERFRAWTESAEGARLQCACMASFADAIAARRFELNEREISSEYSSAQSVLKMGMSSIVDYLATRESALVVPAEAAAQQTETAAATVAELLPFLVAQDHPDKLEHTARTVATMECLLDEADALRTQAAITKFAGDRTAAHDVLLSHPSPLLAEMYTDVRCLVDRQKAFIQYRNTDSFIEDAQTHITETIEKHKLAPFFTTDAFEHTLQDRLESYLKNDSGRICEDLFSGGETGLADACRAIGQSLESMIRIPPANIQTMLKQLMNIVQRAMPTP